MSDRQVDITWLAGLRVLFGLVMAFSLGRFITYGWVDQLFVAPELHLTYFGFGWIAPLSGPAMHVLFWVLLALALAVAAGWCFRITAPLFAAGFAYLQLLDVTTYLNHYYLATLLAFLFAVSPAHRAWSLDVATGRVTALATIPAGWLYLFRFQVAVVYTFAGLAKATEDWLIHAQPLGIWLSARTGLPIVGPIFATEWAAPVMSWAGFLFDTTIPWWLSFRRTRLVAYGVVIVFHVLTRVLFPIGMFPVIMVVAALVFFPPEWGRLLPSRGAAAERLPRAATALAIAYCAVQVLLPLRFLAYGGNVHWHEQGMRFSWRVMVREKNGAITYVVRQRDSGRVWHVSPSRHLTRVQERELSGQPDLILRLAHHIRDDFARRGLGPVEVRADTMVSLNGRRAQPMIDPQVDLARVEDGFGPASWILAEPEGPPPGLRPVPVARGGR